MRNLIIIWLIVCGTSFACIGIVLEAKRDFSINIPIEPTSENNEKMDIDEGIIQYSKLMVYALSIEIENPLYLGLIRHVALPELRPPRAI